MRINEVIIPETPFERLQTNVPATFYAYRGAGGNPLRGRLTPKWQARLGRNTLLGDGIYVAPSESIAGNYGDTQMVKVTVHRPFVFSTLTSHELLRMDYPSIRRLHDSIVILGGKMYNEDMRQAVIFPEYANQIEMLDQRPTMTVLQRGARVRVLRVPPYRQALIGHLVGQTGVVTQMVFPEHPNVRIKGKVYVMNGDDVEVIG